MKARINNTILKYETELTKLKNNKSLSQAQCARKVTIEEILRVLSDLKR